jgi:hypothetical protein
MAMADEIARRLAQSGETVRNHRRTRGAYGISSPKTSSAAAASDSTRQASTIDAGQDHS